MNRTDKPHVILIDAAAVCCQGMRLEMSKVELWAILPRRVDANEIISIISLAPDLAYHKLRDRPDLHPSSLTVVRHTYHESYPGKTRPQPYWFTN